MAALLSRFEITCVSRTGSASSMRGSGGTEIASWCPAASMSGRLVSTAPPTIVARLTSILRSSIFPLVIRDTSSRSSTSRTMWVT